MWAAWENTFLWSSAALLLAEVLGVLPVAVIGRQLRVLASLWRSFCDGRPGPDQSSDGDPSPEVLGDFSFQTRVWLSDVDLWGHLNNCRYYQRCEEGRMHFFLRSNLGALMRKRKYFGGVAGCMLRFRRELRPLQFFSVRNRLLGWDSRSFFIEHKFCAADGFVHAHGLSTYKLTKATCAKGVTPAQILRELHGAAAVDEKAMRAFFPDEKAMEEKGLAGLKAVHDWSSACLGVKKK